MNILVIGVGYVGLVTGTCFAEMGHQVTCLDIDEKKIQNLQDGILPIYEPGLEEMVKRNIATKRLSFTTNYTKAVASSLICFIAVDTPAKKDGSANMAYLDAAIRQLAEEMQGYRVIVLKSTVPLGTSGHMGDLIDQVLRKRGIDIDFDIVSNPEFLKEGDAINDFMKPDRIVIGVSNSRVAAIMKELYSSFTLSSDRILFMDNASAELSKYASNTMLATRISFMNELAGLCELTGADINAIRNAIGSDQRIGRPFLYAGAGYGGSCFPKDIQALNHTAQTLAYDMPLTQAVHTVNLRQKSVVGNKVITHFADKGGLKDKTIGVWGLSFKPGTDDMREAPSLIFIQQMIEQGAKLRLFDPIAIESARAILGNHPNINWAKDELDAANNADALVLMTEWKQFRVFDFHPVLEQMQGNTFIDGRNQYRREDMAKKGFDYISIGRPIAFAQKNNKILQNT